MADVELSIIMPVYNERPTVLEILHRVQALDVSKEIIIVDNCSTDGTRELLQALDERDVRVVLQPSNMRKGNSVKRGITLAAGEYVVVQDGDLEYNPEDIVKLLETLREDGVLAAFGSRILGARERGEQLPRSIHRVGANFINRVFGLLFGSTLTDVASCYKMASRETLLDLNLKADGFDLDYEIAAKLLVKARKSGKRIVEVPIRYSPRTVAEGKKINWRDGLQALRTLFRCRCVDSPK